MTAANFRVEHHPLKTPYGYAVSVYAPDGERVAWRINGCSVEENRTWAKRQIDNYILNASVDCKVCHIPIEAKQQGYCDKCKDEMYQEYLEGMF